MQSFAISVVSRMSLAVSTEVVAWLARKEKTTLTEVGAFAEKKLWGGG